MAKSIPHLLYVWGFGGDLEKSVIVSTFVKAFGALGLDWKVHYWDQKRDSFDQVNALADRLIILAPVEEYAFWCEAAAPYVTKTEVWAFTPGVSIQHFLPAQVNHWIAKLISGESQSTIPLQAKTVHPIKASLGKEARLLLPIAKKISVGRETKGRAGKGVTTLFDIPLNAEQIKDLATTLKQKCGTGGTVKNGCIEIQGDQRERIVQELEKLGFKVKRVGG